MSYIKTYDSNYWPGYFDNFITKNFTYANNWDGKMQNELACFNASMTYKVESGTYTVTFNSEKEYFLFKIKWL